MKLVLEDLLKNDENKEIVIEVIKNYIRDNKNCVITGQSGTGKTTFLRSLIGEIDNKISIVCIEFLPELTLNKAYPEKNIINLKDYNEFVKEQEELVLLKYDACIKHDRRAFIAGELADDALIYYFIKSNNLDTIIKMGTHHAPTSEFLVTSLTNSYISYFLKLQSKFNENEIKLFNDNKIDISYIDALKFVLKCLNVDIHLKLYPDGIRRIERITEIIPINFSNFKNNEFCDLLDIEQEFRNRSQDNRAYFYTKDILKYDIELKKYVLVEI